MHLSPSAIRVIIVLTLLINTFINILTDILNLKNMQNSVPEEFKHVYDEEKYKKSQEYLRACTKFNMKVSVFDLMLILSFWFLKGFPYIDSIVRSWHFGPIVSGLLYIGVLLTLKGIINLPFNIYYTFVIEQKFGFNKTTPALFIVDLIKTIIISALLGGLLLCLILYLLEYTGDTAWLMCWFAAAIFLLSVQYIIPTWILPLFNKFTPLEEGELKQAIVNYANSIDFPLKNIFVMDNSKRSTKSNAFFTGFGKNRRIVLFDTLINEHNNDELVAILAHEMGHFKKKHIIKRICLAILQMGLIFFLLSEFLSSQALFEAFFMTHKSIYAGLIFFGMLYSPIDFFISIILQAISRKDEYEADRFAAKTIKDKENMINALKKLSVHNLSNLCPHRLYVFFHYSHPPIMERIKAIRKLSA